MKTRADKDSVGVWTIGVGHTSAAGPPKVTPGLVITEAEALDIFDRDLVKYEAAVDRAVTAPLAPFAVTFVPLAYAARSPRPPTRPFVVGHNLQRRSRFSKGVIEQSTDATAMQSAAARQWRECAAPIKC